MKLSEELWATAESYVGTKQIDATPMTRGEYNMIRGWDTPDDENPDDGGYIIRYPDGYVSWSPEMQFDMHYGTSGRLNFGDALYLMRDGAKMARSGWNGKNMFIFRVPGSVFEVNRKPLLGIFDEGTPIVYGSHIDMCTADGSIVTWVASQSDMDANDWCIVE